MDKRKIICIVVIIFVLGAVIYKFNLNKVNNKVEEIKQINKVNKKQFAMYIKENGEYKEYTSSDTFPEGYVIDESMSKCYDADNQEIDGVTFTGNSNNITVTSDKTAYCYLYFDEPTGGNSILSNLPADSGLSDSTLGDMRRYQGADVKNYICINETGTKCNSGDDDMYRIIGIVEDGEEAGQIKVIKETKYGGFEYKWNTTESSQCTGTTCSWPNNGLAKSLNPGVFNNLPTKVQNVVVSRQWYYGDISNDYANQDANIIYQIETGQKNTQYYDVATRNLITNQKWKKTSSKLKIGLIYIHDYYWQSTQTNCHRNQGITNYKKCLDNGWMNLAKNGNTSDYEWTMSRIGFFDSNDTKVRAWIVSDSSISNTYLTATYVVRPVFYLSSDVKIKEGGTGEKTNPYILDFT